jgi:hypothetical protein
MSVVRSLRNTQIHGVTVEWFPVLNLLVRIVTIAVEGLNQSHSTTIKVYRISSVETKDMEHSLVRDFEVS